MNDFWGMIRRLDRCKCDLCQSHIRQALKEENERLEAIRQASLNKTIDKNNA
jgi:hypothetical protein